MAWECGVYGSEQCVMGITAYNHWAGRAKIRMDIFVFGVHRIVNLKDVLFVCSRCPFSFKASLHISAGGHVRSTRRTITEVHPARSFRPLLSSRTIRLPRHSSYAVQIRWMWDFGGSGPKFRVIRSAYLPQDEEMLQYSYRTAHLDPERGANNQLHLFLLKTSSASSFLKF